MAAPEEGESDDSGPRDVIARSAGGAAATALAGLLTRAAGLGTTMIVTYFVSKAEYGNANLAMIVVAVLHTLTLLTPQQALLTRHDRFEEASALTRFYVAWSGVVLAALLLLFGRAIVAALGQPEAGALVFVYVLSMILERLSVVPALRLNYELRFSALAQLELWANLAYVAVTISCAMGGLGGYSLALGMVARQGSRLWLLSTRHGATIWPRRPAFSPADHRLAREILAYTLPVHVAGMAEFLTLYLDNVVVGKLYTAAAQGLYVVGYTLAMTPADTIATQGATAMIRALGMPGVEARQRTFLQSLRYLALLLFPIGVLTALVAPTLTQVLLPARWHEVGPIAVGLCGGAMSQAIKRLSFAQLTALHRPRAAALLEGLRLGCFLLGLSAVILCDGARAHVAWVGWGVSAAFVLCAGVSLQVSLRADGLRLSDGLSALGPAVLGSAVTGALLHLLQRGLPSAVLPPGALRLVLELLAGGGIYFLCVRLMYPPLYREATTWLRTQFRARRATGAESSA